MRKKVLFQGGLTMNRAVGSALAQCVGKPVLIPPHPELLRAVGVAFLAMERAKDVPAPTTHLADLAETRHAGSGALHVRWLWEPLRDQSV